MYLRKRNIRGVMYRFLRGTVAAINEALALLIESFLRAF